METGTAIMSNFDLDLELAIKIEEIRRGTTDQSIIDFNWLLFGCSNNNDNNNCFVDQSGHVSNAVQVPSLDSPDIATLEIDENMKNFLPDQSFQEMQQIPNDFKKFGQCSRMSIDEAEIDSCDSVSELSPTMGFNLDEISVSSWKESEKNSTRESNSESGVDSSYKLIWSVPIIGAEESFIDIDDITMSDLFVTDPDNVSESDDKIFANPEKCSESDDKIFANPEKCKKCRICHRTFKCQFNLDSHIRTHTGERPFHCRKCKKSFIQKSHLVQHLKLHSPDNPYKCEFCSKIFRVHSNFQLHMKTHTQDKEFKCDICQKLFIRKSNLNYHLKMHKGMIKRHHCRLCNAEFIQKSSLNAHMIKHINMCPKKI